MDLYVPFNGGTFLSEEAQHWIASIPGGAQEQGVKEDIIDSTIAEATLLHEWDWPICDYIGGMWKSFWVSGKKRGETTFEMKLIAKGVSPEVVHRKLIAYLHVGLDFNKWNPEANNGQGGYEPVVDVNNPGIGEIIVPINGGYDEGGTVPDNENPGIDQDDDDIVSAQIVIPGLKGAWNTITGKLRINYPNKIKIYDEDLNLIPANTWVGGRTVGRSDEIINIKIEGITASTSLNDIMIGMRFIPKWGEWPQNYEGSNVLVKATVVEVDLKVDSNNDREIDDDDDDVEETSPGFKFWINDDIDSGDIGERGGGRQNRNDNRINGARDLEDFALMKIKRDKNISDEYKYYLEIESISGNPSIRVFPRNGGSAYNYLQDRPDAVQQRREDMLGKIDEDNPLEINLSIFGDADEKEFIFEGIDKGEFKLKLVVKKDEDIIAKDEAVITLEEVEDLYAGNNSGPILVFAHGVWNTEESAKRLWFRTVYKRLYWVGFEGDFIPVTWDANEGRFWQYNRNVFNAFQEAGFNDPQSGISQYLQDLQDNNPGKDISLMAHSLGNVLFGQCITNRQGLIKNYILTQAATFSNCYNPNEPLTPWWSRVNERRTRRGLPPIEDNWKSIFETGVTGLSGTFVNTHQNLGDDFVLFMLMINEKIKIFPGGGRILPSDNDINPNYAKLSYADPGQSTATGIDHINDLSGKIENININTGTYNNLSGHSEVTRQPVQKCWEYYKTIREDYLR
jgi:hypothetical protein